MYWNVSVVLMTKNWIRVVISLSLFAVSGLGNAASTLVWKSTGKRELLHDGSPVAAVVLLKDKAKQWNIKLPKNYSSLVSFQGSFYTNYKDLKHFQLDDFPKGALELILFPNTSWFSIYLSGDSYRPTRSTTQALTQQELESTGTLSSDSFHSKKQEWSSENVDNTSIIFGNLAAFPIYAQFGTISVPFGSSFSEIVPSQIIPTRKVYYPRGIGGSFLLGTHYHVEKDHVVDAAMFLGFPNADHKRTLFGIKTYKDLMVGFLMQSTLKNYQDLLRTGFSYYYYRGITEISPSIYNFYIQGRWKRFGGLLERSKIQTKEVGRIEGAFRTEGTVYFSLFKKPSTFSVGFSVDTVEELLSALLKIKLTQAIHVSVGAKIDLTKETDIAVVPNNSKAWQPILQLQLLF